MKKTRIVSAVISVSMSALLLSGNQAAHDFAYYTCLAMNIMAWLLCWSVFNKDTAKTMLSGLYISIPLTALSLYALVTTGHPAMAASRFMLSFFIVMVAIVVLQQKEGEQ